MIIVFAVSYLQGIISTKISVKCIIILSDGDILQNQENNRKLPLQMASVQINNV